MEETYFILRNNEEKGPFNLTELTSFSLLPNDLIWIKGKSTSWQFPKDIAALPPSLHISNSSSEEIKIFSLAPTESPLHGHLIPKTFTYVEVPDVNEATAADENSEEINAEKLQQKADEIYQRILLFEKKKEEDKAIGKDMWQRPMMQKIDNWKENTSRRKHHILLARGAMLLCFLGIVAFIFWNTTANSETNARPAPQLKKYESQKLSEPYTLPIKNSINTVNFKQPLPQVNKETYNSSPSSVDEFIDSIENVLAKHDKHYKKNSIKK